MHIKPIEKEKQIKLIIYNNKFKTSHLIVKNNPKSAKILLNQINVFYEFINPFRGCLTKNKNDNYIGYTTTTLSSRLTYLLSENSVIKQDLIMKYYNSTDQLTSTNVRKILTYNTMIIYENNNNFFTNRWSNMHKKLKKNPT